MAERQPPSRDPLGEWRRMLEAAVASAGRVAGRGELPQDLLSAMRRQLEFAETLFERERHLAGRLVAPVDTLFDLLEETALILRRQSETLEAAGRALEETAGLFKRQAEMFERSIATLRQPAEIAKAVAGLERRQPRAERSGRTQAKPAGTARSKRTKAAQPKTKAAAKSKAAAGGGGAKRAAGPASAPRRG